MKRIPLTKGKFALVDDEDYTRIMALGKWHVGTNGYAQKSIYFGRKDGKQIRQNLLMHRFIMNATDKEHVDHKKGSVRDNRKSNLRLCSQHQNMMNRGLNKNSSTGYKGVYNCKTPNKFKAGIQVNGRQMHLGTFSTKRAAAEAYNKAAVKYFGEFARVNDLNTVVKQS